MTRAPIHKSHMIQHKTYKYLGICRFKEFEGFRYLCFLSVGRFVLSTSAMLYFICFHMFVHLLLFFPLQSKCLRLSGGWLYRNQEATNMLISDFVSPPRLLVCLQGGVIRPMRPIDLIDPLLARMLARGLDSPYAANWLDWLDYQEWLIILNRRTRRCPTWHYQEWE